jgi:hypothetical protein
LDNILSLRGIPNIIKSDNGPPFNNYEFCKYAEQTGFIHRKITPRWPRANGEIERFMRTIKKCIKAADIEGQNWQQAMRDFLCSYRATPHSSTGKSPASLFFKGQFKTKLPELDVKNDDHEVREKDFKAKNIMKHYHDKKPYIKDSNISIGDRVIVKKTEGIKKHFDPVPATVIKKKGTMITAQQGSKNITRNVSLFKRIHPDYKELENDGEEDDEVPYTPDPGGREEKLPADITPVPAADQHEAEPRPQRNRKPPVRYKDYVRY